MPSSITINLTRNCSCTCIIAPGPGGDGLIGAIDLDVLLGCVTCLVLVDIEHQQRGVRAEEQCDR
jgi:hypothetical protein